MHKRETHDVRPPNLLEMKVWQVLLAYALSLNLTWICFDLNHSIVAHAGCWGSFCCGSSPMQSPQATLSILSSKQVFYCIKTVANLLRAHWIDINLLNTYDLNVHRPMLPWATAHIASNKFSSRTVLYLARYLDQFRHASVFMLK